MCVISLGPAPSEVGLLYEAGVLPLGLKRLDAL